VISCGPNIPAGAMNVRFLSASTQRISAAASLDSLRQEAFVAEH